MITVQRLSADASWMLRTPDLSVVFDPWLIGHQTNGARWFNREWHREPCVDPSDVGELDVIVISQRYADHAHVPTLRALPPVPILAVPPAARALRRALPGRDVRTLPAWPDSLRFGGADFGWVRPRFRLARFYAVVADAPQGRFVHAPHGWPPDEPCAAWAQLAPVVGLAVPRIAYRLPWVLGGRLIPGADAAEELAAHLGATWALPIHEEDKPATGLVPHLALRREPRAMDDRATRWLVIDDRLAHPVAR